jgi:cobalt-zinc-cadmium efflux system membrane fusion protein
MRGVLARQRRLPVLALGLALAGLGLAATIAHLTHDHFFHDHSPRTAATPPTDSPGAEPPTPAPANTVTLPAGKLASAGIEVATARRENLPVEVVVAGLIEPNPNKRVAIQPRAAGVIRAVKVQPSQKVKKGDVLAVLDSPDVGTARLNVRNRQYELSVARTDAEWKSEIATNVERLIPVLLQSIQDQTHEEHTGRQKGADRALHQRNLMRTIEEQFANKQLGARRAELVSAYVDLIIAAHEAIKQAQLYREEIVGEHMPFVTLQQREAAEAKFKAALEQVRYDAMYQKRLADQQLRKAELALLDAVKRLQILDIEDGPANPLETADQFAAADLMAEDVTAYPLHAPFDATVLTVATVFSQHVAPTDVLFTLADVSKVYVVANIPETDFKILPTLPGGASVHVTAAAYPDQAFTAKILYTGAMVDPATRRIRLVAEADNPDDLLRLGLFVEVRIDTTATESVVTIPASAVVEIDGKAAVFRPDRDGKTFHLHPVTTGRAAGGRVVVTAGLKPGDRVVSTGAFMLKSELVLQNEPEEE